MWVYKHRAEMTLLSSNRLSFFYCSPFKWAAVDKLINLCDIRQASAKHANPTHKVKFVLLHQFSQEESVTVGSHQGLLLVLFYLISKERKWEDGREAWKLLNWDLPWKYLNNWTSGCDFKSILKRCHIPPSPASSACLSLVSSSAGEMHAQ